MQPGQGVYVIINSDIEGIFLPCGIIPAGLNAGIVSTPHVAGERVSDDQNLLRGKVPDVVLNPGKSKVKELDVWFFYTKLIRNKNSIQQLI